MATSSAIAAMMTSAVARAFVMDLAPLVVQMVPEIFARRLGCPGGGVLLLSLRIRDLPQRGSLRCSQLLLELADQPLLLLEESILSCDVSSSGRRLNST
ncbi:hypothetical protein ABTD35_19525, partial [Acinetobacter baumannii]